MKVSIIVPVYNTRAYLDRCLSSIVNQTLKEIEIIVINDGSIDEIDDIVSKYIDKIKYIKNTNHGIGYTRNLGISLATGEYIAFVDSDDYIDENMYLEYYNFANKNELDVVIGNYNKIVNDQTFKVELNHFDISNIYINKNILIDINYSPWNKLFKRELIVNNNIYFEENLKYEDMPFVIKALKNAKKIGHAESFNYNYIVRGNSETTTHDTRSFDIFKIFDIIIDYFKDEQTFKNEIEYLLVSKLLDYNIIQRNQKKIKIRNNFIDQTFKYVKKHFPNYRKNTYFNRENKVKQIIKRNKILTKLYCYM